MQIARGIAFGAALFMLYTLVPPAMAEIEQATIQDGGSMRCTL